MMKCYSWLFVVFRGCLLVLFFQKASGAVWVFGASELLSLWFTVSGLQKGKVDGSWQGGTVPLVYLLPLLLRPEQQGWEGWAWGVYLGMGLQVAVRLWMWEKISVGVPVFRSVVRSGPFSVIRHPLSLIEVVMVMSFVGLYPSGWNVGICLIFVVGSAVVVNLEERFLWQFKEYREYLFKVPWRWVPGVW
jgi:protein-S-isoprenylcysteine O-methyltransferase Ste14